MLEFNKTSSDLDNILMDNSDINKSITLIEKEINKATATLNHINQIRLELAEVAREKAELLNEDNINLNRSRSGSLLEGFNETIFELDLYKDTEINIMLNKFHQDLDMLETSLNGKIGELKFKLEQQNITKKQKKLNLLRDTLDLQLDTLVSLQHYNQIDFEDLAKESDDILLDKVALDDTLSNHGLLTSRSNDFISNSRKSSPIKTCPPPPVNHYRMSAQSLSPVRNVVTVVSTPTMLPRPSSIPIRVDPQFEKQISVQVQSPKRVVINSPKLNNKQNLVITSQPSVDISSQENKKTATIQPTRPNGDVFSQNNSPQRVFVENDKTNENSFENGSMNGIVARIDSNIAL